MNNQKRKLVFFAVLMLLFSSGAMASAGTDFSEGARLFKAGDYSSAVTRFKKAEKQGMDSVALYYNLASSYYKLEDYEKARHYFELVAKSSEMRDLAEYNLGLIALKQDGDDEARQHFNRLVKESKDEKIVSLARSKLFEMRKADERWKAYVSANMGYDDNITALPSDSAADISDSFYTLAASVDAVLSGKRNEGWVADASYSRLDFSDTDTYDE